MDDISKCWRKFSTAAKARLIVYTQTVVLCGRWVSDGRFFAANDACTFDLARRSVAVISWLLAGRHKTPRPLPSTLRHRPGCSPLFHDTPPTVCFCHFPLSLLLLLLLLRPSLAMLPLPWYRERKCAENYNKWHNKFFFLKNCNRHFDNFKP